MGNIFRTVKSTSYHFICDEIKYLSTSRDVIKEMGEPLIVEKGKVWIFAYLGTELVGFISYYAESIIYAYTMPEFRGKGVFSLLYSELPTDVEWNVTASNASYPIFLKKGFTVIKNYSICHKLKLYVNGINKKSN